MNSEQITPSAPYRRGFIQNRMQNFGWTMIVMGVSFAFYYLGLFGGVDGPLNPDKIGDRLAATGFTNHHLLGLLLTLMAIAIVWNWIYNGICRALGKRMVCVHQAKGARGACGAPVQRNAAGNYACAAGHVSSRALFVPVKKGTVAHFLWMMLLIFSGIVIYLT